MTIQSLLASGAAETHHWLLPKTAEIIYGGLASVIVFGALGKFALPLAKKALTDRTARIQNEIDSARSARAQAEAEASRIRVALGDIAAERARLLAEADQQAAAVLADGRARVAAEMTDMESKAMSDIAAARGRAGDELRAEITRLAASATERVVASAIDDRSRQDLIEGFITKVGA